MTAHAAAIVLLVFTALPARAQIEVTFPLGEHYRIGRYLPLRVVARNVGTEPLRLDAGGAGVTEVQLPAGHANAVVPLLAASAIDRLDYSTGWGGDGGRVAHPLRPLADDERLVGATSPDADLAALLFPGKRIVGVSLDLAEPLPGPPMAWGALDAVFLDAVAAARVSAGQLEGLRASGTAVAVRTGERPAGNWPWQRQGAWWVLPPDERAFVRLVQPARYARAGEVAGAPADFRRVIVLSLAWLAIGVVAASVWRDRRAWGVVVALSVLAAGGIAAWNATQPTTANFGGGQAVTGPWHDHYVQHAARADGVDREWIFGPASWPILFSARHARGVDLTLECRPDGTPVAFVVKLKRGQAIVFLHRFLAATSGVTPAPATATSPATPPR